MYEKIILTLLFFFSLFSCKNEITTKRAEITSGIQLAKIHCSRCHLQPTPNSLSKKAWQNKVLPEMQYYLGLKPSSDKMFTMGEEEYEAIIESHLFPNAPLLSQSQWDSLLNYYVSNGLDSVSKIDFSYLNISKEKIKSDRIFNNSGLNSAVTMVKVNPSNNDYYISSESDNTLEIFDTKHKKKTAIITSSPVSDMVFGNNSHYVLQMGNMNPNDKKQGKCSILDKDNRLTDIITSLKRPVDLKQEDMNKDGVKDLIICNYGNLKGYISWYNGKDYKENRISDHAGPRLSQFVDIDNDGKKELAVLFCQGNEHISIFSEKDNYKIEKTLLSFPPQHGSSYMQMIDVNNDKYLDIITTNGDNADLSIEHKAYHGFRIFINDGSNNFKEIYFYQMPGCSKVLAEDFDKDGDIDFALISFFPRILNEGFVMLKQVTPFNFNDCQPQYIDRGNWLVMDYDKNNNSILLGAYNKFKKISGTQLKVLNLHY